MDFVVGEALAENGDLNTGYLSGTVRYGDFHGWIIREIGEGVGSVDRLWSPISVEANGENDVHATGGRCDTVEGDGAGEGEIDRKRVDIECADQGKWIVIKDVIDFPQIDLRMFDFNYLIIDFNVMNNRLLTGNLLCGQKLINIRNVNHTDEKESI